MSMRAKLPLLYPHLENSDRYFSISLKEELIAERSVYYSPKKLLVISGLEGDFKGLCTMLKVAGVMDQKMRWAFEDGHLVVLGNCFKKSEQVIECLWLLYGLEEKAKGKGGYVHFILGDHEIMNMNGGWRYLQPKYADNVRKSGSAYLTLFDGNNELWRWLRTKNIMEKIGDTLFTHAGISKELNSFDLTIDEINARARAYYTKSNQSFSEPLLNLIFNSDLSPFKYSGYYKESLDTKEVDETLRRYKVLNIITAYAAVEEISFSFNGRVINVNTKLPDGDFQALFIKHGKYYKIHSNGTKNEVLSL